MAKPQPRSPKPPKVVEPEIVPPAASEKVEAPKESDFQNHPKFAKFKRGEK